MLRTAVCVSGGGTNLQAILDSLDQGRITNTEISLVVSNKPDAYALTRAEKHGIRTCVVQPRDYPSREAFGEALNREMQKAEIDLVVLAGYLVILPENLIPAHCGPGYYGLKVHESVLARGNKVTGATVHFVDEGTDSGPIILQKAVEVLEGDTPETLQRRVMEQAEWKILPEAIDLIANDRLAIVDNLVRRK